MELAWTICLWSTSDQAASASRKSLRLVNVVALTRSMLVQLQSSTMHCWQHVVNPPSVFATNCLQCWHARRGRGLGASRPGGAAAGGCAAGGGGAAAGSAAWGACAAWSGGGAGCISTPTTASAAIGPQVHPVPSKQPRQQHACPLAFLKPVMNPQCTHKSPCNWSNSSMYRLSWKLIFISMKLHSSTLAVIWANSNFTIRRLLTLFPKLEIWAIVKLGGGAVQNAAPHWVPTHSLPSQPTCLVDKLCQNNKTMLA